MQKLSSRQRHWAQCFVVIFAFGIFFLVFPQGGSPPNKMLTPSQTLGLAFIDPYEDYPFHLYKRANQTAKRSLYRILENSDQEQFHINCYRMLGYIGDDEDALFLERRMFEFFVPFCQDDTSIRAIFFGLGAMARRGVPEACRIVRKMQELEYWSRPSLSWHAPGIVSAMPFEVESVVTALPYCALASFVEIESARQKIIASTSGMSENVKETVKWRTSSLPHYLATLEEKEAAPAGEKDLVAIGHLFNGDFENPAKTGMQ